MGENITQYHAIMVVVYLFHKKYDLITYIIINIFIIYYFSYNLSRNFVTFSVPLLTTKVNPLSHTKLAKYKEKRTGKTIKN